ncbi:MAG: radical SAM family heme chaperone HemW [Arsenophonus sp.]
MLKLPPLSLYVHIPWCVQKCPYCDFNSHILKGELPQQEYVTHLLTDLQADIALINGRQLNSIFIGGGTPSLLDAKAMQFLLDSIRQKLSLASDAEITIEVNPGTVDAERFTKYKQAGINRMSIGVQSFASDKLSKLGRIHGYEESIQAIFLASALNLRNFNLDLMHGLPDQLLEQALSDLQQAIDLSPPHISWYQLTIEPNTHFASCPPILPNDDALWEIFSKGHQLLNKVGYQQYEISSYAKPGYQCQHNLNYWRFGDYLGIGCGAYGKVSFADGRILRTMKTKHPRGYLSGNYLYKQKKINQADRPFEFFMNRFRLLEAVPRQDFINYTGLSENVIRHQLDKALEEDYITETKSSWKITEQGKLFLNFLLKLFL